MVRDDYDSGRTNLGATGPDAGNEPQEFFDGLEQAMTTHGSQDSMNMNNMLLTNIRVSDYFKLLSEKRTFEEVVDEIYYNVKSAVPWVPGTMVPFCKSALTKALALVAWWRPCVAAMWAMMMGARQMASPIAYL